MESRSSGSSGRAGPVALFVVSAGMLAAVVGLYFEAIPSDLLGERGGEVDAGKGRAGRKVTKVARANPRPKPAAKPGPDAAVAPIEDIGDSSAMAGPEAPAKDAEPETPKTALRLEYEAKAREAPDTPADQKKLALWCEASGLAGEARSHWEAVVRLRPDDEAARGKLGFKRRGKGWKTEAMIAEAEEQARADKTWFATLSNLHQRLHSPGLDAAAVREKALAELGEVTDPLAAYSLWRVFAGHPAHHLVVARQLGRIESPKSSRMLAAVAAYSSDAKAGAAATEELKGRDPVDFAGPLIALLGPTLKVRKVDLPSAPGGPRLKGLEIEDERFFRQFVYMAAPPPADLPADAFGGGCSQAVRWMNSGWTAEGRTTARAMNQAEARSAQESADRQLASDLAAVAALNREIDRRNARVGAILAEATGLDFGVDREGWGRWLAGIQGVEYSPPREAPKVSLAQFVEPMYRPSFITIPPAPS